jgi:hypothetical protein
VKLLLINNVFFFEKELNDALAEFLGISTNKDRSENVCNPKKQ